MAHAGACPEPDHPGLRHQRGLRRLHRLLRPRLPAGLRLHHGDLRMTGFLDHLVEVAQPEKRWYVIHTYSGYEKKVKTNLEHRIETMGMEDKIYQVLVPEED